MLASASTIDAMVHRNELVIRPYTGHSIQWQPRFTKSTLSFGLSYAGYDVSLSTILPMKPVSVWRRLKAMLTRTPIMQEFEKTNIDSYWLAPGEFCLGSIVEYMELPTNMVGMLMDKSTLARRGLHALNTQIEPGWRGILTVELTNFSNVPIFLERGMPIGQIQFSFTDKDCAPYSSKYQDQSAGATEAL